jgi:DNA (cytosine-5)-methyltransferase 1
LACIDLFAGAGGFSLAAQQAGCRISLAIEKDPHAAATYRRNLVRGRRPARVLEKDICHVDPECLASEILQRRGPVDLILGGPPCQGFSSHRLNDTGVTDARNDLIHVYFDFVRAFRPAAFLMENVPGMLWPRHQLAVGRFYAEGEAAGYRLMDPVLLDARDYGVPQRRRRVFILGLRNDVGDEGLTWPPPPAYCSRIDRERRPDLQPWVKCAHVFDPAPPDDPNDVHMNHGPALTEAFARTPLNGGSRRDSGRVLRCHGSHDGHNDVYGRIDPSKPAPTMTTACINPSKGRFVHPVLPHGITVRQAARIQTFPDSFRFDGGLMAAGQQVGNAVPVALARQLIEALIPILSAARKPSSQASAVAPMSGRDGAEALATLCPAHEPFDEAA